MNIRTLFLALAPTFWLIPDAPAQIASVEQEVIDLVNRERAANKLPPLRAHNLPMQAARGHSANMAKQNTGNHVLDGKGPGERLRDIGYRGRAWGENIAWGSRTPQQTMQIWMKSPPHRANILNPNFTEIGVGVAQGRGGVSYWTQVFGRR